MHGNDGEKVARPHRLRSHVEPAGRLLYVNAERKSLVLVTGNSALIRAAVCKALAEEYTSSGLTAENRRELAF